MFNNSFLPTMKCGGSLFPLVLCLHDSFRCDLEGGRWVWVGARGRFLVFLMCALSGSYDAEMYFVMGAAPS